MTTAQLAKLGFKMGMSGWVRNLPAELAAALPLPSEMPTYCPDLIVAFVRTRADVAPALAELLPWHERGKLLWFAYPKRSGSIRTDISRDHGWEPMREPDLLPVMQVALDATWSALRFRHRSEIRRLTRRF